MKPNALVLAVALALTSVATGCATFSSGADVGGGGGGGGGSVAGGADATNERAVGARSDRWAGMPIGRSASDDDRHTESHSVGREPLHEAMTCARCR